jgi:release factor glutamine methyltransferase
VSPDSIASALRDAEQRLRDAGLEAPRIQATTLLGHVLGIDRARLLARLHEALPGDAQRLFDDLLDRRLAREPLQYLVGRADFLDFSVRVGPGVFIPRPETEQLVEATLTAWAPEHELAIDVCSGSGAIAIALARARPRARVVAIELTERALATARLNAADSGVADRIEFVRGDLLTALGFGEWRARLGCVVCNPPYAADGEVAQPEVRDHEPATAWLAGPLGTEAYARVIPQAADLLLPGRPLLLELGYGQAEAVGVLLDEDGRWLPPRVDPDFQGIPRVLTAARGRAETAGK